MRAPGCTMVQNRLSKILRSSWGWSNAIAEDSGG
jgi:hypothetical protein